MAHNVKQVALAKIHFPSCVRRLYSLSMLFAVLFLKMAELNIFLLLKLFLLWVISYITGY